MATGRVEVHIDGLGWVLGLQKEKLRNDDVGSVVVNWTVDADDALLEKAREDVVCSLPSRRVLYNHWDQAVAAQRRTPWLNPCPATCHKLRA